MKPDESSEEHRNAQRDGRALVLLNASAFLRNLHFFGAISVPFFREWVGFSFTEIFLLQAWFAGWLFAMEIPTGVVADRFGRAHSLVAAGLVASAGLLVFSVSSSFLVFFLGETILAVSFALLSGADVALVYDTAVRLGRPTRDSIVRYRAWCTAGMAIGFISGSLLSGGDLLPAGGGIALTWWLCAVVQLGSVSLLLFIDEPKPVREASNPLQDGWNGVRTVFHNAALRPFAFNQVVIGAVTFFLFWFYQPLMKQAGIAIEWNGVVAAGLNVLSALVLARLAWFEERLGVRRLIEMTAFLPAVLFLALAGITNAAFVVGAVIIIGVCRLVREPLLQDLANREIDGSQRATVLSAISMLTRVLTFGLYPILGLLADQSLGWAVGCLGVLCLIGAVSVRIRSTQIAGSERAASDGHDPARQASLEARSAKWEGRAAVRLLDEGGP